jgi:hypothetical protein
VRKVRYAFGAIGVAPMVAVALPGNSGGKAHSKTVSVQPLSQVTRKSAAPAM